MVRNIGIPGVEPPKKTCDDPNCPFHGRLSVRGKLIEGVVISDKPQRTVIVRHDYLHYVKKYRRYMRKHSHIPAHNPPCLDAREGDRVLIAECRPLSKTVAFVVVKVIERAQG